MAKLPLIHNDDDAWKFLQRWIEQDEALEHIHPDEVEGLLGDWPVLRIKLRGDDYHSSLNSGQMSALVDLRMVLGRAYAVLSHGAYDMRRLEQDEEDELVFSTTVKEGSSIVDTDLSPLVKAFAGAVTLYPAASLAAAVLIALAIRAPAMVKTFYEHRTRELEIQKEDRLLRFALNGVEKKQVDTFGKALARAESYFPQLGQVIPNTRQAFWALASSSTDADSVSISDVELTQDDLEVLSARRKKRKGVTREHAGVFSVLGVSKRQRFYRISLHSDQLVVTADFKKPHLSEAKIKRLFGYVASDTKIMAELELRTVDQAQMSARLIKFKVSTD